jgi:RNA polymerase sigma-70 factor, ECF subfamily
MTEPIQPTGGRARPSAEVTDEALLEWVASGEQGALAQLYDRYQGLMYGMATRITGDAMLAQDVVQDAFLGIWRNAARYISSRASARTWILSITHHRAVDALRRRRPTTEISEPDTSPAQLVLPDVWPEVSRRLDAEAVRTALEGLPDNQRQAIELAYFSGLTQQEIADRTEAPLGTVKIRGRLGLLELRRTLLNNGAVSQSDAAESGAADGSQTRLDS